eukprot:s8775_g3.t1
MQVLSKQAQISNQRPARCNHIEEMQPALSQMQPIAALSLGDDDGCDGYDEMQKLLTGSSPAASSASRPPFEVQEEVLQATPAVRRPVNDQAGANMAARLDQPQATGQSLESYDISDEEEEDEEEEHEFAIGSGMRFSSLCDGMKDLEHESTEPIAAEQPQMLLKAKPKTLARPRAQNAQEVRPKPSHPWKAPEASHASPQAMKPCKGAPPRVAKEVAAAAACQSQSMTSESLQQECRNKEVEQNGMMNGINGVQMTGRLEFLA